jgi:RNA polymerase sigma factor (sigma-70 family)
MHTKQQETITDEELIVKIREGHKDLFETLVRRNNSFLYKTAMSYGFSHHDAEDLMQDAFIAAFINLDKFQGRSSFKTWVIKIMLNLCYKKMHSPSFKIEKPVGGDLREITLPVFANHRLKDIRQFAENKELTRMFERALLSLPPEYRMVFSLRELNGMSTLDTAEALGITETNVKVRLFRARHMLREMIEKVYSPEDIFEFNLIYCDRVTAGVMRVINL